MNIDIDSHISLTSNDDIKKICLSFFKRKKLLINHLNYIHKYRDGGVFYLCSNHAWIRHYIANGYMNIGAFETNPALANNKYVLWDSLDSNDVILKDSRELIHVEHGITVTCHTKNGVGFFNFGNDHANRKELNSYINNFNILNEFMLYFYDKTKSIFQKASEDRFIVHRVTNPLSIASISSVASPAAIYLTKREQECITWYLKGKNSGEIAVILGISRRTIETHIERIKLKFNCRNLCQLGFHVATTQYKNGLFLPHLLSQ